MAIIRKKEIKNMEIGEIKKRLAELEIELIKMRAQRASHGGPKKIKEIKRTIARIHNKLGKTWSDKKLR